ncbi:MAG: alpha-mannosidase [Clostridia bacterium]|nr:alpha-mannosidase [Clostridia bacterium]
MKPIEMKTALKEIQIFQANLVSAIYCDYEIPEMEIAVTKEPVPFEQRMGLDFRPVKIGEKWSDRLFDCGWLHLKGNLPPKKEGKVRVVRIDVSGEGCIFDSKGNAIRGITNVTSVFDRRYGHPKKTVVFTDELENNNNLDLWVEIANNDLFGNDCGGVIIQCSTAYLDQEVRALYYDLDFLIDYLNEIDDKNPQYYTLLYAMYDAISFVSAEFKSDEIKKARKILSKELKRKNGASFLTFGAIGHAHLDLAWLWPVRETKRKLYRTYSTVIANMEKYPSYKFGTSQAQQLEWLKELQPNLFNKVKQKVKEGRIELQGGMWVEADTNLTGGESLIRQFVYGKKFFLNEFGKDIKVCWLPDVFGYSAALPQIMKKCGMEYFLTIKLSWSEHFNFPHHTFNWQGIDGSEIFVHMPPEGNYNSSATPKTLIDTQGNFIERGKLDKAMLLVGIGDGGGGPGRDHLERLERAKDFAGLPKVEQVFAEDTFKYMAKKKKDLATWKGELYLDRHQGTLTSASKNKKLNRQIENELSLTEKMGVSAFVNGYESYNKDNIDEIWKETLLYQFHDILPGSSIKRVYDESVPRYEEMIAKLKQEQLAISNNLGQTLCVYNPDCFERNEIVFANGKYYKVCAKPLSYTALIEEYKPQNHKTYKNKLENKYLKVDFSADGSVSITDKINNEVNVVSGNVFKLYNEFLDCWDMSSNFKKFEIGEMKLVSRKNYREGDASVIEQTFGFNNSLLVQKVMLKDEGRIVDFRCKINWQETKKMLRVEFDPYYKADVATCDIQFGSIERPTYSQSIEQYGKYEVSMHKYVDISNQDYGVALFNDGKYGVNVKDGKISINLLRSQTYPCVDCDNGEHEFSFAVYPHSGNRYTSDVVVRSVEYNHPLAIVNANQTKSLFTLSNNSVLIETVKMSEEGKDIILRLYEINGKHAKTQLGVNFACEKVYETNMLESVIEELICENGLLNLTFKPFEIKTLMIRSK